MSGLRPDSCLSKNRSSIYVVCVMVVRTLSCLSCNCMYMCVCESVMVVRTLSSLSCNRMCICGCVVVKVTSLLVL